MKVKFRYRSRVSMEEFFFFMTLFCVVTYALLEHMSISVPFFSIVKMPLMQLGAICLIPNILPLIRAIKKKRYFYVMMTLFLFLIMLECSAVYYTGTKGFGGSPQARVTRLMLYLTELFFLMIWAAQKGRGRFVMDFLFYYIFVIAAINDLFMLVGIVGFGGVEGHYLVGTKFTVSYLHLNLLTFWYIRSRQRSYSRKKSKRVILYGMPVIILVCLYVDCVTGVLGSLLLLLMFFLINGKRHGKISRLKSPVTLFSFLTASVVFPFLAEQIISLPVVLRFIENIAGREADLTGRVNIFIAFIEEMEGHWLWGYGFGNANSAAVRLFGYANAQNALLQWVFQVGIPTTAVMILLMLVLFRQLSKSDRAERAMPLVLLIYLYIVLGMIEITFSMSFILWLALIFLVLNDREQPKPQESEQAITG